MKPIYKIKFFLKRHGIVTASALLSLAVFLCVLLLAESETSELAFNKFRSENAVNFRIKCENSIDFWRDAPPEVQSISFFTGVDEENEFSGSMYISFADKLRLPPVYKRYKKISAEEWNKSEGIAFAGKSLKTFKNKNGVYYVDNSLSRVYFVMGTLGFYKTTLADVMLYLPFDGIITPEHGKTEFCCDGRDRKILIGYLEKLSIENGAELTFSENENKNSVAVNKKELFLIAGAVCTVSFLYLIYRWFESLENEIYILNLLGVSSLRAVCEKMIPIALCSLLTYTLCILTTLCIQNYFIVKYTRIWLFGLLLILFTLSAAFIISCLCFLSSKDTSSKIK